MHDENVYLMVVSVGPVQDFIAAARRTRDLWFGSYIMSELAKSVAKCLIDHQFNLIFPGYSQAELTAASSIGNVILAYCNTNKTLDFTDITRKIKVAVQNKWLEFSNKTWDLIKHVFDPAQLPSLLENWNHQIQDIIECYCAWTLLQDKTYAQARQRVMTLLDNRKMIRDFQPNLVTIITPQNYKSSLDGARDAFFPLDGFDPLKFSEISLKIRLNKGERLSAIDLIKRLCVGAPTFPSLSRVAIDPWIRGIENSDNHDAKNILEQIKILSRDTRFATGTGSEYYQNFPFDGQYLFAGYRDWETDRKSTRLNSSHSAKSRMPSSA